MLKRFPYFKPDSPDSPPPLCCSVSRKVRFEEIDPLNIMWHGRYPSYLEDARIALGNRYKIGYMDFYRYKIILPIKQMHIDYLAPLTFGEEVNITARLHYSEAAKLNFSYEIHDSNNLLLTTAYTVQLLLQAENNELCLALPDFFVQFCENWKKGL
ncbi:acyl-CoA thioesterase [Desulfovibrio litoralis]|uniref:Acyl-CoA thioester hydrolase n=1 Tax=Desulfovibrio litoralis DSM 11393 TaxID=1121455 RepID=A0A1M7STR5_9BACT|nr:acyl-CoA thioesterase [Desulfovibrio litoralis]SHN61869.1 acyl-CoA thioester hydrolase [Desulfovibrio litoralis DSM 11393]